jgi:SAM-dependent methyltransferase
VATADTHGARYQSATARVLVRYATSLQPDVEPRASTPIHEPVIASATTDLFADKSADWDTRPLPQQLYGGIGAAIASRIELRPSHTILDFGAGTGLLTGRIAPRVASVVAVDVDVSPAMLEQLSAKLELQGKFEPICLTILETPFDRRVELVVGAMAALGGDDLDEVGELLTALVNNAHDALAARTPAIRDGVAREP